MKKLQFKQINSVGNETCEIAETEYYGISVLAVTVPMRETGYWLQSDNGCERYNHSTEPTENDIFLFAAACSIK